MNAYKEIILKIKDNFRLVFIYKEKGIKKKIKDNWVGMITQPNLQGLFSARAGSDVKDNRQCEYSPTHDVL